VNFVIVLASGDRDQRHLIGAPTADMPVERVVAGVDHRAGEPAAIEADAGSNTFFAGSIQSIWRAASAQKTLGSLSERACT